MRLSLPLYSTYQSQNLQIRISILYCMISFLEPKTLDQKRLLKIHSPWRSTYLLPVFNLPSRRDLSNFSLPRPLGAGRKGRLLTEGLN